MNKVRMESNEYPYDMSNWCCEKSKNVVKDLTSIIEILKCNEDNIQEDLYENINDYLHSAIIDATKIYGFASGSKLLGGEGDLIFDEDKDGLEKILVQFGRVDNTSKQKEIEDLQEFISELSYAINGDRTNRTMIHSAMAKYQNRIDSIGDEIKQLENSIEKVTVGELSWESFIQVAKFIIPRLENELEKLMKNI